MSDDERDIEAPERQWPEDTDNCSQIQSQQNQSPLLEEVCIIIGKQINIGTYMHVVDFFHLT